MCACEFSVFSMQCYTHSAALEDVTHIHLLRSSSLIFVVAFLMARGSLPYIFIAFDVRHADLVTFKWDDLSPLMHMAGDEPTYVMKLTSLKVLATETTTDAIATQRMYSIISLNAFAVDCFLDTWITYNSNLHYYNPDLLSPEPLHIAIACQVAMVGFASVCNWNLGLFDFDTNYLLFIVLHV